MIGKVVVAAILLAVAAAFPKGGSDQVVERWATTSEANLDRTLARILAYAAVAAGFAAGLLL